MGIRFYFKRSQVGDLSNIGPECAECMRKAEEKPNVIRCHCSSEKRRHVKYASPESSFYFCSSDEIKSSRIFKQRARAYENALSEASKSLRKASGDIRRQSRRQLHNLIKLNAQAIQEIYATFPPDAFHQRDREQLMSAVQGTVVAQPEDTSKLIVTLLKNENLKKVEFAVYNKIFEAEELDISSHEVHRVVLLVLNMFWSEFRDKDMSVQLGACYRRALIDFDAMSAVLFHVFQNTVKYTYPGSAVKIFFETDGDHVTVCFDMLSLYVTYEERGRIYEEGYSGSVPRVIGRAGGGIGLWVVQELVQGMGGEIFIQFDVDEQRRMRKMGVDYTRNILRLKVPVADSRQ